MTTGTKQSAEQKRLKAGCELLVATPGRLQDHLDNSSGFKASLGQLAVLILDEADQLLEMGFKKEIEKILRSLPPPSTRQTLLFSATVTPQVQQIAQSALRPGKNQAYCDCISKGEDHTHAKVPQYVTTLHNSAIMPHRAPPPRSPSRPLHFSLFIVTREDID